MTGLRTAEPFDVTTSRTHGTRTVTSAMLGTLRSNPSSRAEFLALVRNHREPR